jgi:N-glycosylase/DNA lyase
LKEQRYVLENCNSFELKDVFDCGQCFRWNEEKDNSYTGVFGKNVLNVKKEDKKIIFQGISEGNIEEICREYFDLDTDYEEIKKKLARNR